MHFCSLSTTVYFRASMRSSAQSQDPTLMHVLVPSDIWPICEFQFLLWSLQRTIL